MTNEEIDLRLRALAQGIPLHAKELMRRGRDPVARELELLNMSAMAVWAMLGEIAKRLPEPRRMSSHTPPPR